jgi:tetratricopeptide (TPR) repeat protein
MPDQAAPAADQSAQGLDAAAHDELRQIARDSYARGDLPEAIDLQLKVIAAGPPEANDALFLALMLFATHDVAGGIQVLRDSIARFPDNPALHENLAVCLVTEGQLEAAVASCHQALALGSASPNVHDCLCDALNQLGRTEAGIEAGRIALEAKHKRFGAREPIVRIPAAPPPPFNPGNPAENVISYCLWGNEQRYQVPLQENVRILPHLFPAWSMRVYYDTTVDHHYITDLGRRGVQLRQMILPQGQPAYRRLLWRFEVIRDPSVRRFLIRDADALLNIKERVAVDAWLQSDRYFHAMRDWHSHTDLILAGMWAGSATSCPRPPSCFAPARPGGSRTTMSTRTSCPIPCGRRSDIPF